MLKEKASGGAAPAVEVRGLVAGDFDDVVSIDAAVVGRKRRAYFERRLKGALRAPAEHVQFAATRRGELVGCALARRMLGEFGRTEAAVRLETIVVPPEQQGRGVGMRLLRALERWSLEHDIRRIRTTADWRRHAMLGFLDRAGFELASNQIVDCAVHADRLGALESDDAGLPREALRPTGETDYGAPSTGYSEALARDKIDIHALAAGDLAAVLAIDRRVTGRSRDDYLRRLFDEALNESAIRVSLVAREDMTVGFVMARTDFGDFGRTEPTAVIDTIGVHPDFARGGVGTALLSQLFVNLHALQVERVETVVGAENLDLLGFFHKAGFSTSQRLALVKHLS